MPEPSSVTNLDQASLSCQILAWYDRHRRHLPWRAPPGRRQDPYAVWLSEIMLQQTTVATVAPYFDKFMALWPTVEALAAASLDQVLHAWQGLGYYARARNMHRCAQMVAAQHAGRFPANEAELRTLPGIGGYTAAAIAAIAYDLPAVVVDGNVERVMARLHAITLPLPTAKQLLYARARALTPLDRAGDYAQAVMDLGATICTPRQPRCLMCPWRAGCSAGIAGRAEQYPVKLAKPARPVRYGTVFWITRRDGSVLMRRRAENGLLGGLMEFPSTPWLPDMAEDAVRLSPIAVSDWRPLAGEIRHVFTHFELRLRVVAGTATDSEHAGVWAPPDRFAEYALPTLMKKVAALAVQSTAGA